MSEDAHDIDPYAPLRKRGLCPCCEIPKHGLFVTCSCDYEICWRCRKCIACCALSAVCVDYQKHEKTFRRIGKSERTLTPFDRDFLNQLLVRW